MRSVLSWLPDQLHEVVTKNCRALGEAGAFMHEVLGSRFDFSDIVHTQPTELFDGEMVLHVGSKEVRLIELGPAHTRGDALVYVPQDRTVFSGDLLFVWAGPIANWIAACDTILSRDVETIVPGHGPITDKAGVRALKHYLEFVYAEARKRYVAGLDVEDATRDISWGAFRGWIDLERVDAAYREFSGDTSPRDMVRLFTLMPAGAMPTRHPSPERRKAAAILRIDHLCGSRTPRQGHTSSTVIDRVRSESPIATRRVVGRRHRSAASPPTACTFKTNRNLVPPRRIRIAAMTFMLLRFGGASDTLERRARCNPKSDGSI